MKYNKTILLFIGVYFFTQSVQAQVRSQDTMIQKLFSTLYAKDEKAFVALYPNSRQFGKMMRMIMEQTLKSEQMQKMMAADEKSKNLNIDSLINVEVAKMDKPEVFAEMQKGFGKNFQKIIAAGEKKGVSWNKAKFVSYSIDTLAADKLEMEMFKGSGIKTLKGVIDFNSGDSAYQVSFDKIILIPSEGGWFGGEFQQLIRKGEQFTREEEMDPGGEVMEDAKEMAPPPPPRPKTKIKTKQKTTPVKTKTKTKS